MRGEILYFDDSAGRGLLTGDDGNRYEFGQRDLFHPFEPTAGDRVDFVAGEDQASKIVLVARGRPSEKDPDQEITWSMRLPPPPPRLGPWGYFLRCSSTAYFQGEGRASLKEYWSFILIKAAVFIVLIAALVAIGVTNETPDGDLTDPGAMMVGLGALMIGFLALYWFIPGVTALVRRLHDMGQSGFWVFLVLVPLGPVALLVMSLQPSTGGPNKYGAPPPGRRGADF